MTTKNRKSIYLHIDTMIDPATDWIEIVMVPSVQADLASNQVKLAWLTRYSSYSRVIVHLKNEFLAEFKTIMQVTHGIQIQFIISRNLQAHSI